MNWTAAQDWSTTESETAMVGNSNTKTVRMSSESSAFRTITIAEKENELFSAKSTNLTTGVLIESSFNELTLAILKFDDTILDCAFHQNSMDSYRLSLSNTMGSIHCLHLNKWIPTDVNNASEINTKHPYQNGSSIMT